MTVKNTKHNSTSRMGEETRNIIKVVKDEKMKSNSY